MNNPLGLDISHLNDLPDDLTVYGLAFLAHKASQGSNFHDSMFSNRRMRCRRGDIPFMAYHFGDHSSVNDQLDNFKFMVGDNPLTVALDWEPNGTNSMTSTQVISFLKGMSEWQKESDQYLYLDRSDYQQFGRRIKHECPWIKIWIAWPQEGEGPLPEDFVIPLGFDILQYSDDKPGYHRPDLSDFESEVDWNVCDASLPLNWPKA